MLKRKANEGEWTETRSLVRLWSYHTNGSRRKKWENRGRNISTNSLPSIALPPSVWSDWQSGDNGVVPAQTWIYRAMRRPYMQVEELITVVSLLLLIWICNKNGRSNGSGRHFSSVPYASVSNPFECIDLICISYSHILLMVADANKSPLNGPLGRIIYELEWKRGKIQNLYLYDPIDWRSCALINGWIQRSRRVRDEKILVTHFAMCRSH